jgi:hypothetical protein
VRHLIAQVIQTCEDEHREIKGRQMLGWQIYVNRSPSRTGASASEESLKNETLLASWLTGLSGCKWIEILIEQGYGKDLGTYGGYPHSYSAKAKYVIPLILSLKSKTKGPTVVGEDYVHIGGFNTDIELFLDRIKSCPLEEELSIEAWDQS